MNYIWQIFVGVLTLLCSD